MPTVPLPQLSWPASAPANSFVFTYPPVEKPMPNPQDGDEIESVRVDSLTLLGLRQSMFYYQPEFLHLRMKFVPKGDMANWKAFLEYAQQGGSFLYYPDSTARAFDEYWLEDSGGSNRSQSMNSTSTSSTNWNPKYSFRTINSFEIVMRKVPGGLTSP